MMCVKTKVSDEEPVVFDTGYLHSWGSRVIGVNIHDNYTSSLGSRVHFPEALVAADYGSVELFQFVSTLAVNPYTWGFDDGLLVTSQLVRVAFAFVNGSYLVLSGLRPTQNIEVELTRAASAPEHRWTSAPSTAATPRNISAVELVNAVELRPFESKFARINVSLLGSDGVAAAAEVAATGKLEGDDGVTNSTGVSLDVFIGYTQVAHRHRYDLHETFSLPWNAASRQYELYRYLFLPLR